MSEPLLSAYIERCRVGYPLRPYISHTYSLQPVPAETPCFLPQLLQQHLGPPSIPSCYITYSLTVITVSLTHSHLENPREYVFLHSTNIN